MPTCPDDDRIGAWLEGSLSSEEAADIEAHVDGCSTCYGLVNEIARVYAPSRSVAATGPRTAGATLAPNATFDRYVIEELVGAGGMGAVYRARDSRLRRTVALKVLHATGEANRARITREAQLLARLGGAAHIVPIYDVGSANGRFFIVMEFVRGRTVDAWLREAPRTPREIVALYVGALRGVAEAHRCGVVHRDLKPSNILVDDSGRARVVDFGLARSEPGEDSLPDGEPSSTDDKLTVTGAVVGTPRYMAPEQHLRGVVDERTDQFALCICLYEALFERHPFDGDDYDALRDNVVAGKVHPPPRRPGVSRSLREAVLRGLEPDPARRWASLAALERALVRGRRPFIPLLLAAAASSVIGIVAVSGSAARPGPACTDDDLSAVWNDAAAAEIRAALAASGAGFADETAGILHGRIDAWVDRWSKTRARLCADRSATAGRRCLDRDRAALEELVRALGTSADAAMARRAVGTVSALPDPESCELATEPPDDGRQQERTELEAALARVAMLKSASRMQEARDALEPLLTQARALRGAPLAEALRLRASFLHTDGAFEDAAGTYEEAFYEAQSAGADVEALHAALQMVFLMAHSLGRIEDAYAWADKARGLLPRVEGGHFEEKLDMQLANIAYEERRFDEAIGLMEGVVEAYRTAADVDPSRLGKALNNIGLMNERAGNLEAALRQYDEALEVQSASLGASHPDVATIHSNRANVLVRTGEIDEGRQAHQRALDILTAAYGPDHPELYHATYGLGLLEEIAGNDDTAARYYQRALDIRTAIQGRNDPEVAHVLYGLAGIAERGGDRDLAERRYLEALGILERVLGAEHPDVAITLEGMGIFYSGGGDHAAARRYFERALSIQRANLPANHPDLGSTLTNLATALERLGDDEAATAATAEASAIKADFRDRWPQ